MPCDEDSFRGEDMFGRATCEPCSAVCYRGMSYFVSVNCKRLCRKTYDRIMQATVTVPTTTTSGPALSAPAAISLGNNSTAILTTLAAVLLALILVILVIVGGVMMVKRRRTLTRKLCNRDSVCYEGPRHGENEDIGIEMDELNPLNNDTDRPHTPPPQVLNRQDLVYSQTPPPSSTNGERTSKSPNVSSQQTRYDEPHTSMTDSKSSSSSSRSRPCTKSDSNQSSKPRKSTLSGQTLPKTVKQNGPKMASNPWSGKSGQPMSNHQLPQHNNTQIPASTTNRSSHSASPADNTSTRNRYMSTQNRDTSTEVRNTSNSTRNTSTPNRSGDLSQNSTKLDHQAPPPQTGRQGSISQGQGSTSTISSSSRGPSSTPTQPTDDDDQHSSFLYS